MITELLFSVLFMFSRASYMFWSWSCESSTTFTYTFCDVCNYTERPQATEQDYHPLMNPPIVRGLWTLAPFILHIREVTHQMLVCATDLMTFPRPSQVS